MSHHSPSHPPHIITINDSPAPAAKKPKKNNTTSNSTSETTASQHDASQNATRDASTSLKSFLLEQIAASHHSHNDYYTLTLRKALRNLADEPIYEPQDAMKVKGVGKKTVERFENWLREKGVEVLRGITRIDTEASQGESDSTNAANGTASRKRKRYAPKEGSVPAAILAILKSYYNDHKGFPTKHKLVTLVRDRHAGSKRTAIMTSIRNLAVKQGVVIEINGSVELSEEGWDVVGGKPGYLKAKRGRVEEKEEMPMPVVRERVPDVGRKATQDDATITFASSETESARRRRGEQDGARSGATGASGATAAPSVSSASNQRTATTSATSIPTTTTTASSTTSTNPPPPQQPEYPIRMSFVDHDQNAVPSKDLAAVRISGISLLHFVCIVFPLHRESDVRATIPIDNSHAMRTIQGLGMLYGWISDESNECRENSDELGEAFFGKKRNRKIPTSGAPYNQPATPTPRNMPPPATPKIRRPPTRRIEEEDDDDVMVVSNNTQSSTTSTLPPQDYVIPVQTLSQPSTDPNTITFASPDRNSARTSRRNTTLASRKRLLEMSNAKLKLANLTNTPTFSTSNEHTSINNRITYNNREYDIILLVDNRERLGHDRNAFLTQVKHTIAAESFSLSLGDFVWVAKPVNGNIYASYVLDLIVERKIADDLASSIRDGRKKNQNFRMQRCGVSRIYYLVEGRLSSKSRFSSSALVQSMTNMIIRDGFTVTQTSSDADTMDFLWNMTSSLIGMLQNNNLVKYVLKDQESAKRLNLSAFNEIGGKDKHLSYPEILGRQLYCLKGCSRDAALAIVEQYPSFYELRQALLQADENDDGRGKVSAGELFLHKHVGIPAQGHLPAEKINKALSRQIYQLVTKRKYPSVDGGKKK